MFDRGGKRVQPRGHARGWLRGGDQEPHAAVAGGWAVQLMRHHLNGSGVEDRIGGKNPRDVERGDRLLLHFRTIDFFSNPVRYRGKMTK